MCKKMQIHNFKIQKALDSILLVKNASVQKQLSF